MYLYNVTIKVDRAVEKDWLRWLKQQHIPKWMATGKFTHHRLCRLLLDEPDGVTYAVQLFCPDFSTYQRYQEEDAPRLKKQLNEKFGDRMVVFSTIMEVL